MNRLLVLAGLAIVMVLQSAAGEDPAALLDSGKKLLGGLAGATPRPKKEMLFECQLNGETVGWMTYHLSPAGDDAKRGYAYETEMMMQVPDGKHLSGKVTADLRTDFSPTRITLTRTVRTPDGTKTTTDEKAVFEGSHIALTRDDGKKKDDKNVPRPTDPFIFGIEFLIQHVDFAAHPRFAVHEINPQTGATAVLEVAGDRQDDGRIVVTSKKAGGKGAHRFVLASDGSLLELGESSAPMTMKLVPKERVEQIKDQMKKP